MKIGSCKRPNEEQNFDSKIFIKHASSQHIQERVSYNQNFHHDHINTLITNGGWGAQYADDDMNFYEL